MRVIRHLARRTERLPGSVLTLGNFDGAHLGHQAIVRRAVARARESAGLAVALTFEPHPVAVLAPGRAPLGRSYALRGRVVVGDRRGRTLGFPTANLHLRAGLLLPPDGVYAVGVEVDGRAHEGVLNIGVRPTFAGRRRTIEVHLLDFSGDLYRRWLVVKLIERLRGEEIGRAHV